ncbi:hypothetical protein DFJ58DRAFT_727474 [Suillus subalutaceus]|uniref:uncharacterized protein n=1 Tax=Suillus subalutaceus TaxID=48586 RepID=UPI001B87526D|nr:uncharacterized protein DFJ58DRAFT_727474 [Suillus subalutaceus]KAG1855660.1 hypothetical protein DFJ58DRAFT_727474 [Suillus subalutaceus]
MELVAPVELEVRAVVDWLLLPPNPPKHNHLPRSQQSSGRAPQDVDDDNGFGHMDLQPESSGSERHRGCDEILDSALSVGPSPSGSRSTSESRKWPHDIGADVTKKLADASDSLLLHVQNKSDVRASSKRMKFEYARFSKELKAHEAHAEHEHDSRQVMANHDHECAISEDKTRQLELEI